MTLEFRKVTAGYYATADGRYAVAVDGWGYVTQAERDGTGVACGVTGGEWAAVYDAAGSLRTDGSAGENLDWFATKREAVEFLRSYAARRVTA